MENTWKIDHVQMECKAEAIMCPLGRAPYTAEFTVDAYDPEEIPDYLDVQKFLDRHMTNSTYIIEELLPLFERYLIKAFDPLRLQIIVSVRDAAHFPVTLAKFYFKS